MSDDPHPHRSEHSAGGADGVLRASVFGVSDGLVSNGALVMGVAAGQGDPATVIVAGVAGLLAGGCSMAAGEYVSMQTQREVFQRELALEREHLEAYPDEERADLTQLLLDNGVSADVAFHLAHAVHEKKESALHLHALMELGINPNEIGAPVRAALYSFLSFVTGAAVPLLPWLILENAFVASALASCAALLAVGAAATRVTHQPVWKGAGRQLLFGLLAGGITFGVGVLLGQATGGAT